MLLLDWFCRCEVIKTTTFEQRLESWKSWAEAGKLEIAGNFNTISRLCGSSWGRLSDHWLPGLQETPHAKHLCRTLAYVSPWGKHDWKKRMKRGVTHPCLGNGPHSARRRFWASKASRRISQWPGRILRILWPPRDGLWARRSHIHSAATCFEPESPSLSCMTRWTPRPPCYVSAKP